MAKGVTPVAREFSYESEVLLVVKNQPVSLSGLTTIQPIQARWLDQWLTILALMVEEWLSG
jgi:hypothetical protein